MSRLPYRDVAACLAHDTPHRTVRAEFPYGSSTALTSITILCSHSLWCMTKGKIDVATEHPTQGCDRARATSRSWTGQTLQARHSTMSSVVSQSSSMSSVLIRRLEMETDNSPTRSSFWPLPRPSALKGRNLAAPMVYSGKVRLLKGQLTGDFRLMHADLAHEAFRPLPQGFLSHGQYTPIAGLPVAGCGGNTSPHKRGCVSVRMLRETELVHEANTG